MALDYNNEQLNAFSAVVMHNANEERDRLMKETEAKYKSIIAERENEYLEEAYEIIQKSKSESERFAGEELLHAEMDSKKQVLLKREEIINNVMDSAKTRLAEFTHSGEYEEWLVKKAQSAAKEALEGGKIIYVSEDDMRYADKLKTIDGGEITVEAAPEHDFIGGVRVYNTDRRISVDYSFKELLADEKQSFLRSSGLVIR